MNTSGEVVGTSAAPLSSVTVTTPLFPSAGAPAHEEARLLAGLRAGNADAHEAFVRAYAGRVKAVAERYLRNEEDAGDVVQETFLSAFKAIHRFEGKSQLSTWLHRIAVNAALMKLRSLERKDEEKTSEGELDELLPRFVGFGAHASSQRAFGELPEEGVMRQETCSFVRACIDQLPQLYRTALLLRDIEGYENDELARHLGISVNAAKIRVHRARQALRTLLEPRFTESHP
jgi:RNA polymerase sigma-70 factor (ECF subfamily)